MLTSIISGICAGILISIGGTVYLACDNKIIGALFFCVALLCICFKGYDLFTGKVGYLAERHDKSAFSDLLLGLLGNTIGTILGGYLIRTAMPTFMDTATVLCTEKLSQSLVSTLIRSCFCGILMYLAVSVYKENKTPIGILFCIPVFILSGFEHSIADIFYFSASGLYSLKAFWYIWIVIFGNAIGAIGINLLGKLGHRSRKESK